MTYQKTKVKGYYRLVGNHAVFTKYLTGKAAKDRDRLIENMAKGIVSFNLK